MPTQNDYLFRLKLVRAYHLYYVYHDLHSPFSQFLELRGAGGGVVDDVGNDEIRLLDHPLVPVGDGEALRDGLDALRENVAGVVDRLIVMGF